MDHLKTAYNLGARLAQLEFTKQAEPALGDPAFWQGGEQAQQEQQAPATAEDAAMSLPTGTFQGLTTRLSPEGERSTSVKVTPDALGNADILTGIFQAEPTAKVEVAQPQAKGEGQQDLGIPGGPPGPEPRDPLTEPKVGAVSPKALPALYEMAGSAIRGTPSKTWAYELQKRLMAQQAGQDAAKLYARIRAGAPGAKQLAREAQLATREGQAMREDSRLLFGK